VKCEIDLFSWYTFSSGVPQGSVLGLVLFVMYTTPLSTLISTCSLNYHINADDTQLFLSFLPAHFDSSIDYLYNALDRISSWMTGNLLILYSPKTEFLLIGLSKQLAKINNSLLTPLETSASYRDKHLTFLTRLHLSPNLYYYIRQLHCSRPYLDTKTASPSPLPFVHSKLDYCNTLYHNQPKYQITRLQQIQNCLARAVVRAPKSSHVTPILRSLHWLKVSEYIKYKLLSPTYNQSTYISA